MKKNFRMTAPRGFKLMAIAALITMMSIKKIQAQEIKGEVVGETVTVTATVLSVDQASRKVTIKTDSGKTYSFVAGDNVKNLAQVKKGDIITAKYTEALAYQIRKPGAATGVETTNAAATAAPGEKPAGVVAQQTTVAVTVTAIDPSIPSVTFKGPQGNSRTIKVKDPQKLVGVKVGDVVDITYSEAMAISVSAAAK